MEKLELIKTVLTIIISFTTIFGAIFAFFKKTMAKQTANIIKQISDQLTELKESINILDNKTDTLDTKLINTMKVIDDLTSKNKNEEKILLLDVKCGILNICRRANRFNGITLADKELLCELYEQYVHIWHKNHFIKSEADYVIDNLPTIEKYDGET